MSKPEQSSKVTIEDLLRLKRAEKPDPEFWVNFEQELRQKQLTALVQKRRWWHELPVLLNRRLSVPAGAAAIVAFTLVTVRYSTPMVQVVANTAPQVAAADPAVETLATIVVAGLDQEHSRNQPEPLATAEAAAPAPVTQVASGEASPLPASREVQSSPARSLITNLARLEQAEPDLVSPVMGSRLSSPARVQTAALSQSELAPVANVAPSKYRLIARYADRTLSPEPSAPASIRERLARRLGDDLGDSISRIGVVGDRVSLKF